MKLFKGKSYKQLIDFMIPAAIEMALIQLVSIFDQIQVSAIGTSATSAVGVTLQVSLIFSTLFLGINIGVTTCIAQSIGAKKIDDLYDYFRHGVVISFILTIPWIIVCSCLSEQIINLFGVTDPKTYKYAVDYLRIIYWGFIPHALTMAISAAFKGTGDSRTPMIYNILANILNVFFNWVLINGKLGFPRLEVKGAAIASVMGQFIAFIIAVWFAVRIKELSFPIKLLFKKYEKLYFKRVCFIGMPAMLESLIVRLGVSIYTVIVIELGTLDYAVHVICQNIQTITIVFGLSLSAAATTVVGISKGANDIEGTKESTKAALVISQICALTLFVMYFFFGKFIVSIYNNDIQVVTKGSTLMRILAYMTPFAMVFYTLTGSLRGCGDTKVVAVIAGFTSFVCRPLIALFVIRKLDWGLNGAWIAMLIDQFLCAALMVKRFLSGKWVRLQTTSDRL